jgi:hypothetical protein
MVIKLFIPVLRLAGRIFTASGVQEKDYDWLTSASNQKLKKVEAVFCEGIYYMTRITMGYWI